MPVKYQESENITSRSSSRFFKNPKTVVTKADLDAVKEDVLIQDKLIFGVLFVVGLAIVGLIYDAIRFHSEQSARNEKIEAIEQRLQFVELQNKILRRSSPDLFDSINLDDLESTRR